MYTDFDSSLLFFAVFFLGLALLTLSKALKRVPQSEEWTVERFGRFNVRLRPGLNIIIPFIDQVSARISMRETVLDVPSQDVITRDNAMVRVDGVVFFQAIDAVKVAYEVANLHHAIVNLTMTNIRTIMGGMDLDELLSNRDKINSVLMRIIDDATSPWGIKVTRIEIKDIHPPKNLVDAMARQMKAEREKRAAILEAQGLREAEILKAEGEKQGQILAAEGLRQAQFMEAEARERLAEAEAKATKDVSEAISKGDLNAIHYFVASKYVESFKALAESNNQKVVLMPFEASQLIGTLGGIGELSKHLFKEEKS